MILILGALVFTNSCKAQKNSELPEKFFQRWKLDYGTANGKKIEGLPQSPNNDYEFKQNGEYLLYNEDNSFIIGTWEYNTDEKVIYTKRKDGEINGKITDLQSEHITLIPAGKASEGTRFKNFRFHYIPKTN
ncbi:hypothetical protein WJN01_00890 [Flavobacteriaceae bacterium SZ-1-7]|uniref:hypothetical protein n=1 Tax=Tamlana sedimenti TaxID=3134126 RepID=UPI0031257136